MAWPWCGLAYCARQPIIHKFGGGNTSMINRRSFLGLGTAATLCAGAPGFAKAGYWDEPERQLAIHNLWTEEYVDLVYWVEGEYQAEALADFDYVMRDRRNNAVSTMFYELFDQLFWLRKSLRTQAPIGLVSGYRSPATNKTMSDASEGVSRNSLHTVGMAADIRIEGLSSETIWQQAIDIKVGGTGLYRDSKFVHIDVGPRRKWIS